MLKKRFTNKHFLLANLILLGVVLGFGLALVSFSCTTDSPKDAPRVRAQSSLNAPAVMNLEDMQNSFRAVSAAVLPVVVEITVTEVTTQTMPDMNNWPFNFLFPDSERRNQPREREYRSQGLGSGVIVQQDGDDYYVLTNNHVVDKATEINVILYDGQEFAAELVGRDERKDIAVIKFKSSRDDIPLAVLGDSDSLFVGDWVLAVGNPFGYVSTVTAGIVSALGRQGPTSNISDFIQTDAAINQGNSGGALVNLKGEVVGINTWIATNTGSNTGLGFAIPINNVKKTLEDFISLGEARYGWLGVSISDIDADMSRDLKIEGIKGALIHNVYKGSPADRAGLLPGDWVYRVNGRAVNNQFELNRTIGDFSVGEKVTFDVYRYGEAKSVQATIAAREGEDAIAANYMNLWPGLSIMPLTENLRSELKLDGKTRGVMVAVNDRSKAQVAGIKTYDIVTAINGRPVANMIDFYRNLNESGSGKVTFSLLREGAVEMEIGIVR